MFKKNCVDLIYRVICLCTFVVVIIFSKSLITLAALTIFFFFITKSDNDFLFIFFYLLSMLFFAIVYFTEDFLTLKLISIIEFSYYFLNIPRVDKLLDDKLNIYLDRRLGIQDDAKGEAKVEAKTKVNESELDYIRFKPSRREQKVVSKKSDLIPTLYLTVHLIALFVSIAIG